MKYFIYSSLILVVYLVISSSCGINKPIEQIRKSKEISIEKPDVVANIKTGAENIDAYLPLLKEKKIGVVANQSSQILKNASTVNINGEIINATGVRKLHLVDFLKESNVSIQKIFAPEHGFRGNADAGELIKNGKDTKTGLPIISLYGDNKKPKPEQLVGIDIMVFDLQDVGARFYTYISTLHYMIEACAENNIQLIVLDRPNPNIDIIDGPILEKEFTSFVGMHQIPLLHGMTIGEYAKMINGEKWLNPSASSGQIQCNLMVIPCLNYSRKSNYSLPVKPSPNLPNDQSINLYASLCLFEGTNVSVGRGTETQFQVYGSPFLPKGNFSFVPVPNFGAKDPLYKNEICNGESLVNYPKVEKLELKWLIKAYKSTKDKTKFFNPFFTKLAGTKKLQIQIENGVAESEIRKTWAKGLEDFLQMRFMYLIYK